MGPRSVWSGRYGESESFTAVETEARDTREVPIRGRRDLRNAKGEGQPGRHDGHGKRAPPFKVTRRKNVQVVQSRC